ncbi:formate-dependent phosphoribosylglycinamide formyltransferase [Tsukamurella sp. 8F]|uniref:formate-dependent phosphoribosylglycinamide formyltransferase n=1 Tax=unclassified Tsukamurella TaxID=2633480 RepID=UPI0023B91C5A|nr:MULTISPECIES: formate-dependent phosphoribosylglycinamide formyltransferase [unclassified Tsukamurella]MDF0530944.1 formate-dependent phosphoribosylglycinamide formyltransferase [Tsukamurella sp. 8J]MDF0588269.1 formate-dependent phosphoribosylglycinamide formyltransferase [Tsukamurella sp. 8F]
MTNLASGIGRPRIGTALTPGATRVLLLGAGELGKEVVIAFQRLGVETIAVDRYENAPAMQVAHRSHVIDLTDPAAIRAVIDEEKPDLVIPEIEAIATDALAGVEADGVAEVIPTARAVRLTMDREGIRKLASEELGLPCSPYRFASDAQELAAGAREVGFPCVVKPVVSSSGKGQTVVRGPADLAAAWDTAVNGARVPGDRVIVEGFVDFDYEITLLTVRVYDAQVGRVVTKFCEPIGHRQEGGDYVESWQPQPMSQNAYDAATSVAGRIVTALGDGGTGGRGVFGVELFVKGDDVYFSEVSPRPHDTGLVTLGSQRLSEFELHARAVLGLPVDTSLMSPAASAVVYGTGNSSSVAFDGVADAMAVPESELRLFGKPEGYARRRLGVAVATADTIEVARRNAVEAASRVRVVDSSAPVAAPEEAETTAVPVQTRDEDPATRAMPLPPQRPVTRGGLPGPVGQPGGAPEHAHGPTAPGRPIPSVPPQGPPPGPAQGRPPVPPRGPGRPGRPPSGAGPQGPGPQGSGPQGSGRPAGPVPQGGRGPRGGEGPQGSEQPGGERSPRTPGQGLAGIAVDTSSTHPARPVQLQPAPRPPMNPPAEPEIPAENNPPTTLGMAPRRPTREQ